MALPRTYDIGGSKLREEMKSRLKNEFLHPSTTTRSLPTEVFFDTAGLKLWSSIVDTPEYTQLRHEVSLMRENAAALCQYIQPGSALIDMGSG